MSLIRSHNTKRGLAAAAVAAILAIPQLALARPNNQASDPRASLPARLASDVGTFAGAVSLDEAVAQAEKRYSARVVKAETKQEDGKSVHELRLLSNDGRVWTIRVNASTGAVL